MKTTTANRLAELMNMRGMKQSDIVALCLPIAKKNGVKIGKSYISQYVSGKYEPSQKQLTVLGEALDVSEVWLMGYDVPMERQNNQPDKEDAELTEKIMSLFSKLDEEQMKKILDLALSMIEDK